MNGELFLRKMVDDFKAIDRDGNGFIDRSDLEDISKQLEYEMTDEELDFQFRDMDQDNDGQISLEDFIAATVKIST